MSNQDQKSTRLGTMVFTIANELVNHYSKKLDREVIDEITSNLTLEMCQGPTAWAFSGKDEPGTCQQPQPDVVMAVEFDRVIAERDALQQRLNAADERNEELSGMLQHQVNNPYRLTDAYREQIAGALKREPAAPSPPQPITEQFIEDHLGNPANSRSKP